MIDISSSSSSSVSQLRHDDDQQQDQCDNDTDDSNSSSTQHVTEIGIRKHVDDDVTVVVPNKEEKEEDDHKRNMVVQYGDIVTLTNVQLLPEYDFIPEQPILFCNDDSDEIENHSDHSNGTSSSSVSSSLYHTSSLTFIVGWGNYIPGLHDILLHHHCSINDTIQNISIDAGYGHHQSNLIFHIPISKLLPIIIQQQEQQLLQPSRTNHTDHHPASSSLSSLIQIGMTIRLKGGIDVVVTDIITKNDDDHDETMIVVDANPPLAGSSYSCSFTVSSIQRYNFDNNDITAFHDIDDTTTQNQQYQMATFALGCFWGAELAFMRVHGVVGTRVGYTQGITSNPTYHDVCQGYTQHRESVQVVYDTTIVSYEQLMDVALLRLQSVHGISSVIPNHDVSKLFHNTTNNNYDDDSRRHGHNDDMDEMKQYRHGFYYHTKQQRDMAMHRLFPSTTLTMNDDDDDDDDDGDIQQPQQSCSPGVRYEIEIQKATKFWIAELYHQQYLYKGGQSARKGSTIPIRCYG